MSEQKETKVAPPSPSPAETSPRNDKSDEISSGLFGETNKTKPKAHSHIRLSEQKESKEALPSPAPSETSLRNDKSDKISSGLFGETNKTKPKAHNHIQLSEQKETEVAAPPLSPAETSPRDDKSDETSSGLFAETNKTKPKAHSHIQLSEQKETEEAPPSPAPAETSPRTVESYTMFRKRSGKTNKTKPKKQKYMQVSEQKETKEDSPSQKPAETSLRKDKSDTIFRRLSSGLFGKTNKTKSKTQSNTKLSEEIETYVPLPSPSPDKTSPILLNDKSSEMLRKRSSSFPDKTNTIKSRTNSVLKFSTPQDTEVAPPLPRLPKILPSKGKSDETLGTSSSGSYPETNQIKSENDCFKCFASEVRMSKYTMTPTRSNVQSCSPQEKTLSALQNTSSNSSPQGSLNSTLRTCRKCFTNKKVSMQKCLKIPPRFCTPGDSTSSSSSGSSLSIEQTFDTMPSRSCSSPKTNTSMSGCSNCFGNKN